MPSLYNRIGKKYDVTRQADTKIVDHMYEILKPQSNYTYLDIGCGSGNYTIALSDKGIDITGLDISDEMLNKARSKQSQMKWIQGDAKALPFLDNTFDGVICFLAIHHIGEPSLFFKEVYRVLKPLGKFLLFANSPEQFNQLWLIKYFPKMMTKAASRLFTTDHMQKALHDVGFDCPSFEKYFVHKDLQDAFLEQAKFYPKLCLDPIFRANTSPFALAPDEEEVKAGLKELALAIESNEIEDVMRDYPNIDGNFYYILSSKR